MLYISGNLLKRCIETTKDIIRVSTLPPYKQTELKYTEFQGEALMKRVVFASLFAARRQLVAEQHILDGISAQVQD